jgi:ribosome-associated protein
VRQHFERQFAQSGFGNREWRTHFVVPGLGPLAFLVDRYHSRQPMAAEITSPTLPADETVSEIPVRPEDRPSKTQRKREMHARQALGQRLVDLNTDQLARLALPETLLGAIVLAQRVNGHEARRRQLQYVGKLMRDSDYEAIASAYDGLMGNSREAIALMHRCERLRDQLIDDEAALAGFLRAHPGIDTQWLRAKVRAARQERSAAKAPRHARELYKWLHALLHTSSPAGSAA